MKITRVKFYQAVSVFNGTKFELITHLNLEDPKAASKMSLELISGVGLKVKTVGDSTIITLNNIAFMSGPEEEVVEKPKSVKKA